MLILLRGLYMKKYFTAIAISVVMSLVHAADPLDEAAIEQAATDFDTANTTTSQNLEDEILISQIGIDNFARTDQLGTTNANVALTQTGNDNAAGTFQNGINNNVVITQQGNGNFLIVTQTGDANTATLNQTNDYNNFNLNQSGGSNSATVTQTGNSSMALNQTGSQAADISLQGTAQGSVTQLSPTLFLNISN
jgi:hypothetical protein